jgi:hypothetical protein
MAIDGLPAISLMVSPDIHQGQLGLASQAE